MMIKIEYSIGESEIEKYIAEQEEFDTAGEMNYPKRGSDRWHRMIDAIKSQLDNLLESEPYEVIADVIEDYGFHPKLD